MIPFTKMHGLGNDFIVIERVHLGMLDIFDLARRMCDRHIGVGADGLILVSPSDSADIRMRIINRDGSEAEMCGNGIRCLTRYAYDRGLVKKTEMKVETLAGIIRPALVPGPAVAVEMGRPEFERVRIPMAGSEPKALNEAITVNDKTLGVCVLRMGVPHAVVFVKDIEAIDLFADGPALETHPLFPQKTNVDFVQVLDSENIVVRTWERGAGATLACGTGACASAVAAYTLGHTGRKIKAALELGALTIEYREDGTVLMTGPAEYVFEGTYRK